MHNYNGKDNYFFSLIIPVGANSTNFHQKISIWNIFSKSDDFGINLDTTNICSINKISLTCR
jgi:hypothetical protein